MFFIFHNTRWHGSCSIASHQGKTGGDLWVRRIVGKGADSEVGDTTPLSLEMMQLMGLYPRKRVHTMLKAISNSEVNSSSIEVDASDYETAQNSESPVAPSHVILPPPFTIESICGKIYWTSEPKNKRFIVIVPDNGVPDSEGNIPNLGIVLNTEASEEFTREYDKTIFDGDQVEVGIRVLRGSTLANNLAAGHGLRDNRNPLQGMSIQLA